MTWEEASLVEKFRGLFRPHGYPWTDGETRRNRSKRFRYFLTVFGAMHFAERIDGRRIFVPRRGRVAL